MAEFIECVLSKYEYRAEDRGKVRRAVRVARNNAATVLRNEDVQSWTNEMEFIVGVRRLGDSPHVSEERGEWWLEARY